MCSNAPTGTSTSADTTPVISTSANSHAAAVAYRPTMPWAAAGRSRQASPARSAYTSIPAHSTAGSRWQQVTSAPATGITPSGCERMASARTTPHSTVPAPPGRRIRNKMAATANRTASATAIFAVPPVGRPGGAGTASRAARPGPASAVSASATLAVSPSSAPRSAHGGGSGPPRSPLY